ncbi:MAG: hypothetical protein IPH31_00020 [Lewinellaceae bacterium]|nr:hypothetical protein [Lewinellaceae bacterium]
MNSLKIEDSWISKELKIANSHSKPIYTINLVPEANLIPLENKFSSLKQFAFIYNELTPQDYVTLLKPLTIKQGVVHKNAAISRTNYR